MAMFVARAQRWLLVAAFTVSWPLAATGEVTHSVSPRGAADVARHSWSAIGKLANESGSSCSGVVIGRDKVLTAAHCVYNSRTRQFIAADALHFLAGYRTGTYAAHARVAMYQIGAGFDPLRYAETSDHDWAVLTLTEPLPASIVPLKLGTEIAPSGTKAVMAGYPQTRAHALTFDSDCELRERVGGGRLYLHTCAGIGGYSGAPIMVQSASEMRVAGIQIAKVEVNGTSRMLAVPARAFARTGFNGGEARPAPPIVRAPPVARAAVVRAALDACDALGELKHALLVTPVASQGGEEASGGALPAAVIVL
jgi:protease YdgD